MTLQDLSIAELLRFVDRSHPEVRELASRLDATEAERFRLERLCDLRGKMLRGRDDGSQK